MLKPAGLGRLWRTVRWLKPVQVWGRVRFRLQRPRPDLRAPPALRTAAGPWLPGPGREPSMVSATRFRFLSEEHDLAEVGWDDSGIPLLWRYNQHYFDDLNAQGAGTRRQWHQALLSRWLAANPPRQGTAWAPYPLSLRVVNWIKWFMTGEVPSAEVLHSLVVQVRWLTQRLEWHLLGNHLFINAKALVFAGLWFEGPEAERWLRQGLQILQRELPEQILADGGQFERSPMYHALALEDLLDLLNIIAARAPAASAAQRLAPELHRRSVDMLHWLRCLRHPGGALARFNDCAEGIAPEVDALERYAAVLGVEAAAAAATGVLALQASGYVRAARGAAVLLMDLAPIGPDYLPGHAHADTLSFELSVAGREIIVNRGTSVYGTGPRRQLERGTSAHSTVQIGNEDSSEVWAGFRVGRRARPGPIRLEGWLVEGSHDGYVHLPGRPRHLRRWQLLEDGLLVDDELRPAALLPAVARYHLAPGLALVAETEREWRVVAAGQPVARIEVLRGFGRAESWQHALRFGVLSPASTLAVDMDRGCASVRLRWNH